MHPSYILNGLFHFGRYYNGYHSMRLQQMRRMTEQQIIVQTVSMARYRTLLVRRLQCIKKIRRIGYDKIETYLGTVIPEITTQNRHPVLPCRTPYIFFCLFCCSFVYLDSNNSCLRCTLSQLQGYQTCTGSDIQHIRASLNRRPRSQQYAIRANLHGTFVMPYGKMFKLKKVVRHRNLCY